MITKIPERVDLWRRFGSKKKSRDSAHLLASCPHPPLPPSPFPSLHFLIIFFCPPKAVIHGRRWWVKTWQVQ